MQGKITKREVEFDIKLNENEVKAVVHVFRDYFKRYQTTNEDIFSTGQEFIQLLVDAGIKEEEVISVPQMWILDPEILSGDIIYMGDISIIKDFEDENRLKDKFKLMWGQQNQLAICRRKSDKIDRYNDNIFFNYYCARLIADFITNQGRGLYYGWASKNTSQYYELDVYVDNNGVATQSSYNKSLKLRYYHGDKNVKFGIIKDEEPEIILNNVQADILKVFIGYHI